VYFLVLEMFLWDTPTGHRTFGLEPEFATASKALAANQGLYNGFLAAGLVWGLVDGRDDVELFFLACVIVAGAYGAVTVNRRILFVQALPALVAFVLLVVSTA
jgi:putative membrane protein